MYLWADSSESFSLQYAILMVPKSAPGSAVFDGRSDVSAE